MCQSNAIIKVNRTALMFIVMVWSASVFADSRLLDVVIDKAGVYRLSHDYLMANGIDLTGLKHRRLSFEYKGEQVPTYSQGQDANPRTFGSGAFVEFVVPVMEPNLYNQSKIYTLHYQAPGSVRRVNFAKTQSVQNTNVAYSEHYLTTLVVEEQTNYSILSANAQDPWNMAIVSVSARGANDFKRTLDLPGYVPGVANVKVSAKVAGMTNFPEAPDHHVQLRINDQVLVDRQFEGVTALELHGEFNQINATDNEISIGLVADLGLPFDLVEVDQYSVSYPTQLFAQDNQLQFATADVVGEQNQVLIQGFQGQKKSLRVYQVINDEIAFVRGVAKRAKGDEFSVKMGLQADADYFFAAENGFLQPAALRNVMELDDIRNGKAEYLIISHADFINDELTKLVDRRRTDYDVKVVDVAQVYAQFGGGMPDAAAIKEYLAYAVDNLATKMVVLVGGDSRDYHGYKANSAKSFIPTLYRPTKTSLTINFTPSDAAYGDLDDDGIPDIAVGRLPVRTQQELADVITKIELYEQRDYNLTSVIAADKLDNGNQYSFTNDANGLVANMPAAWSGAGLTKAYIEQDGATESRDALFEAVNQGVAVTAYVGHTGRMQWASSNPRLLHSNDIPKANAVNGSRLQFTNFGMPTLVTQWGCWNTYFVDERTESVSQALLLRGTNGAVASIGASSLTTALGEKVLGGELYKHMFKPGVTIGEALITAKQIVAQEHDFEMSDIQLGIQLLGDPALVMMPQ